MEDSIMKKITILAAAALSLFAASSCKKDIIDSKAIANGLIEVTFDAYLDEAGKATLADGKKLVWSPVDSIAVWDGTAIQKFRVKECDGTKATFIGTLTEGYTACNLVYPYTALNSVKEGKLVLNIPASQKVSSTQAIDPTSLVCTAYTTNISTGVNFKNAVSLMKFTISASDVYCVYLIGNAGEIMCGYTTTDNDGVSFAPVMGPTTSSSAFGSTRLYIKSTDESGYFTPGTYYAALLPTNFTQGVTVAITQGEDVLNHKSNTSQRASVSVLASSNAANFQRSGCIDFKNIDSNAKKAGLPKTISTPVEMLRFAQLGDLYKASDEVKVISDIDMSGIKYTQVRKYYGTFSAKKSDTENYKISGLTIPVFGNLFGIIKDLDIETALVYEGYTPYINGTNYGVGALCHYAYGYVENDAKAAKTGGYVSNVNVKGSLTLGHTGTLAHYICLGGIVGCSNGDSITGCSADINLHVTPMTFSGTTSRAWTGGIVGLVQSIACNLDNNTVKGSITIDQMLNATTYYATGGIIGWPNVALASCENNVNYANISAPFKQQCQYAGGICGYVKHAVTFKNCTNYGNITYASTELNSYAGGIVAFIDGVNLKCEGCKNYGEIDDNGTPRNVAHGGIIGYSSKATTVTSCENYGKIKASGDPIGTVSVYCCLGGIAGWTAAAMSAFTSCKNEGEVLFTGSPLLGDMRIGGICGNVAYGATMTACQSLADIKVANAQPNDVRIGGLAGSVTNQKLVVSECSVGKITISHTNTSPTDTLANLRIGGFAGYMSCGATNPSSFAQSFAQASISATGLIKNSYLAAGVSNCASNTKYAITECGFGGSVGGVALNDDNVASYIHLPVTADQTADDTNYYYAE